MSKYLTLNYSPVYNISKNFFKKSFAIKYYSGIMQENTIEIKSLLESIKRIVPRLNDDKHKGQAGRIGVIGGSLEYTGAPFFAAISALRVGADLVHIFCQHSAAPVIKSYSPELIVHPLLDSENALDQIEPWLERLHVLVVGPGLGRDRNVMQTVAQIIRFARKASKPLVIDADGLHLIQQHNDLIKNYDKVILTPNAIEFSRLFGSERELIPNRIKLFGTGVTILEKGRNDRIYMPKTNEKFELPPGGSGRRCGGQGDLLAGALATFYHWALESEEQNPELLAISAASYLIKQSNSYAFQKFGRSVLASDMIKEIHNVFDDYFEPPELGV
ncbi:ATP-dependent (S)-NAD(P)H-hydrate dehydratase [Condylostylus longicornis]|uniref:ATP-dependent (S)-NAD(P)H-hydrate dehydratase n=1 Tax=Condylostylus longicornis TaxID=2530218 RepID=UPI00244DE6A5|nr:ATP-dependent (S)-NAD(P)H-hydrate dehydratase [Condylostylus longicornis]